MSLSSVFWFRSLVCVQPLFTMTVFSPFICSPYYQGWIELCKTLNFHDLEMLLLSYWSGLNFQFQRVAKTWEKSSLFKPFGRHRTMQGLADGSYLRLLISIICGESAKISAYILGLLWLWWKVLTTFLIRWKWICQTSPIEIKIKESSEQANRHQPTVWNLQWNWKGDDLDGGAKLNWEAEIVKTSFWGNPS